MHVSNGILLATVLLWAARLQTASGTTRQPTPNAGAGCRHATLTGEVEEGMPFRRPLGGGLDLLLQPIHSGWIVRVLPAGGPGPAHDYAELATPPYNSVTPLSLSTDFAFRAQDAVGWNPRRFRLATTRAQYEQLAGTYDELMTAGVHAPPAIERRLAAQIAMTAAASLSILDARLVPGTADQLPAAAAVASHFSTTAHTLDLSGGGRATPLGKLVWLRFRVDLNLPVDFRADPSLHLQPEPCAAL